MDTYTSDSSCDNDNREHKTIDYSYLNLDADYIDDDLKHLYKTNKLYCDIEKLHLNNNGLLRVPLTIEKFTNLKVLDISSNGLTTIPEIINNLPLIKFVAKNNLLTNESLPKTLLTKTNTLREINLSGNKFDKFPEQLLELKNLRYLYLGGNNIKQINKDIWRLINLQLLSLGGNQLVDVPESVGNLQQLHALILCDNFIEALPSTIAKLTNLKTLSLHKNKLRHLPRDIITLKNLNELSLRDNPLVVRFVQGMSLSPPTLLELAARVVKVTPIPFGPHDLPKTLFEYLNSANCCVNPKCRGVFFDNRVEHIKFVDFCGKYRVPLLQYLCSSKCVEGANIPEPTPGASGYMMRKVLLG